MRSLFRNIKIFVLMILLNVLIVAAASVLVLAVFQYLGISPEEYPLTLYLVFYSIIGMGGAFFSLAISRFIAKKIFKIKLIQRPFASEQEGKLYQLVEILSKRVHLSRAPELGVFESPEINAFATGPSRNRSLVAVSSALLQNMDEEEIEGVVAHEMAHIANGDMVTMTILQGIVNTMVLFLARIVTELVLSSMRRRSFWIEISVYLAFQMVLNILGSILIINVFSRFREYKADMGAAKLVGKEKIIKALQKLQQLSPQMQFDKSTVKYNAFKIMTPPRDSLFRRLLSTHPPLQSRIKRIQKALVIPSHF